jgi:hypothetical protein
MAGRRRVMANHRYGAIGGLLTLIRQLQPYPSAAVAANCALELLNDICTAVMQVHVNRDTRSFTTWHLGTDRTSFERMEEVMEMPQDKDKTRQNLKWHLFIYYVLNGYSLFPFQEALVPGSQYLFIFVSSVAT